MMPGGVAGRYVARTELINEAVNALCRDGVSIALAGEAGIGKTAFIHQVLAHIGSQRRVVYIRPSSLTAGHPYGALTFLLGDFESGANPHPVQIISTLAKTLNGQSREGGTIVAVEDAHYLDEFSSIVLHELARNGTIQMLLAARDFAALPLGISSLWREDLLQRIDLAPMDVEECRKYLEGELAATVSGATLNVLAKSSGGNPRLLWAMGNDLRDARRLTLHGDVWALQPGLEAYGHRTADAMAAVLEDYREGAREVIDILSLAGNLPLLLLLRTSSGSDIDMLQEKGVVTVEQSREHTVHLTSPVLSDSGRWRLGAGRHWELYQKLLAVVGSENELPLTALRHAQWIIGYGGILPAPLAALAAHAANDSGSPELALQFAECTREHTLSLVAEVFKAQASLADDRVELTLTRMADTSGTEEPAEWVAQATAQVRLLQQSSSPGAGQVLEHAVQRFQPFLAYENLGPELFYAHQMLLLAQAELASYEGKFIDNVANLPDVYRAAGEGNVNFKAQIGSWLCESWALTDHQDEAVELAAELRALLKDPRLDRTSQRIVAQQLSTVYFLTGIQAPPDLLEGLHGDATPRYLGALPAELLEGIGHAHRGYYEAATRSLLPVLGQLQAHDPFGALPLATAAIAYCRAAVGDVDGSRALMYSHVDLSKGPWQARRSAAHFKALTAAIIDSKTEAIKQLNLLSAEDQANGAAGYELLSLYHLARLGDPSAPDRLLAATSGLGGTFTEICALFAKGLASQDPSMLIQAAELAKQNGHSAICNDAADFALNLSSASQEKAECRRMQKSARWAMEGNGLSTPESRLKQLTSREREIAAKVSEGRSSKEIAVEMFLSVRTIEGHLYRIYAKLAVKNRMQLANIVQSG